MLEIIPQFEPGYLLLCLPFLLVWTGFYILNKSTRREQLWLSYIAAVLGPFSELIYTKDYWYPLSFLTVKVLGRSFFIEDIVFGFAIGGISAVCYEVILNRRLVRTARKNRVSGLHLGVIFIFSLILLLAWGVNSIYASAIAFLTAALMIVFLRRDLFFDAVMSGLLLAIILFASYKIMYELFPLIGEDFLQSSWYLYETNMGRLILGIPMTELIWAFCWGAFGGPVYEYLRSMKLK